MILRVDQCVRVLEKLRVVSLGKNLTLNWRKEIVKRSGKVCRIKLFFPLSLHSYILFVRALLDKRKQSSNMLKKKNTHKRFDGIHQSRFLLLRIDESKFQRRIGHIIESDTWNRLAKVCSKRNQVDLQPCTKDLGKCPRWEEDTNKTVFSGTLHQVPIVQRRRIGLVLCLNRTNGVIRDSSSHFKGILAQQSRASL